MCAGDEVLEKLRTLNIDLLGLQEFRGLDKEAVWGGPLFSLGMKGRLISNGKVALWIRRDYATVRRMWALKGGRDDRGIGVELEIEGGGKVCMGVVHLPPGRFERRQ